ncbi:pyridoxamine 5'-phosphate oxidase family protein [Actinomadura meridiana]|uniref:Pyridoxamine 5'-phosphate oxidase family protein n=1 Tax=Actinomadura meridiana TaxID=559626 RepID=A0ABP8BUT6_9ACTN
MATWKQFEAEAADLAARIRKRFEDAETHVLATLRKDGSPRVSGSEVDFRGPDLSFGSMLDAMKARDLRRDGRCAVHAHPADPADGGDAKVAGVAVEVTDPEEKKTYTTGNEPPGDFHAFRLDLREAVLTSVEGDRLVIQVWRPGEGVRTTRRE